MHASIYTYEHTKTLIYTERDREMFYLTTHSTHFIHGYMASDIWLRTILIVKKETCCRHIGYSYRLTTRVLLYAPSHKQDNTYHSLCYTSRGALAGMRNIYTMHVNKHTLANTYRHIFTTNTHTCTHICKLHVQTHTINFGSCFHSKKSLF